MDSNNCPGQNVSERCVGELCWYSSYCSSFIFIHTGIISRGKGKTSSFNTTSLFKSAFDWSGTRNTYQQLSLSLTSVRSQLLPTHFLVSVRLSVLCLISCTSAVRQTRPPGLSWTVTDAQQSPHPYSTSPDLSDLSFQTADRITTTHGFCHYNESQCGQNICIYAFGRHLYLELYSI